MPGPHEASTWPAAPVPPPPQGSSACACFSRHGILTPIPRQRTRTDHLSGTQLLASVARVQRSLFHRLTLGSHRHRPQRCLTASSAL